MLLEELNEQNSYKWGNNWQEKWTWYVRSNVDGLYYPMDDDDPPASVLKKGNAAINRCYKQINKKRAADIEEWIDKQPNYDSVHTAAASGDPDDGPDTDALLYGKWALSYKIASW